MKRPKVFAWSVLCLCIVFVLLMGFLESPADHTPAFWVAAMGFAFLGLLSFGFLIANGHLPLHADREEPVEPLPSIRITFIDEASMQSLAAFIAKSMPKSGIREDDGE